MLFTPYQLGPITLRNRAIRSAAFENMAYGNAPSQDLYNYHTAVAKGGAGEQDVHHNRQRDGNQDAAHGKITEDNDVNQRGKEEQKQSPIPFYIQRRMPQPLACTCVVGRNHGRHIHSSLFALGFDSCCLHYTLPSKKLSITRFWGQ